MNAVIDSNKRLYFKYGAAVSVLDQQFKMLAFEYQKKLGRNNPIEHLKYRIKSDESVKNKLIKLQKQGKFQGALGDETEIFTAEAIEENIHDVVGYRIVCPFLDDVYKVLRTIKDCLDIEIVEEKDYIKNPKNSGYSSYHLKVLVPVEMPDTKTIEKVKAEIQIRTITMDMLASLEHKIQYKKNVTLLDEMQDKLKKTNLYCKIVDRNFNDVLLRERERKEVKREVVLPSFFESIRFYDFVENNEKVLELVVKKINEFNRNCLLNSQSSPIEHVKYRIKEEGRIYEKLNRQNRTVTFDNMIKYINDVAGVRIVCPFLDDVQTVIDMIKKDDDLEVIEEQDYINQPKECGYASYHMLLRVPIQTTTGMEYAKVEVQIRSMVQEMWAILQERLCYQREASESITKELNKLSRILLEVDYNMNEIVKYSRDYRKMVKCKEEKVN